MIDLWDAAPCIQGLSLELQDTPVIRHWYCSAGGLHAIIIIRAHPDTLKAVVSSTLPFRRQAVASYSISRNKGQLHPAYALFPIERADSTCGFKFLIVLPRFIPALSLDLPQPGQRLTGSSFPDRQYARLAIGSGTIPHQCLNVTNSTTSSMAHCTTGTSRGHLPFRTSA